MYSFTSFNCICPPIVQILIIICTIISGELHCHGMWNVKLTPVSGTEIIILQYLNTSRSEFLRSLIRRPSGTVPHNYYYTLQKLNVSAEKFLMWE